MFLNFEICFFKTKIAKKFYYLKKKIEALVCKIDLKIYFTIHYFSPTYVYVYFTLKKMFDFLCFFVFNIVKSNFREKK